MRWTATNCPAEAERDPGRNSCTEKTGSVNSRYAAPGSAGDSAQSKTILVRHVLTQKRRGLADQGDFNVHDAICCFTCTVASGIFRVPRCRRADSPFANHSGDFFGDALLQGP